VLAPVGAMGGSGSAVTGILGVKKAACSAASFAIDPLRKGSPIGSIATTSVRTAVPLVFGPARRRDIPFRSTLYYKANRRPNLARNSAFWDACNLLKVLGIIDMQN